MPQPPEVTAAADELIRLLSASQQRLWAEYARVLTDPKRRRRAARLRELLAVTNREIAAIQAGAGEWLTTDLLAIYERGGVDSKLLSGPFQWTQINKEAVQALAVDTYSDVLAATDYMGRDAKRWIRQTSRQLSAQGYIEGMTPQQLAKQMSDLAPVAFADAHGVPLLPQAVRYADGSYRGIDVYGEMLFRTKSAIAYNRGTVITGAQVGVDKWEINDGPGCGLEGHDVGPEARGMIVSAKTALEWPIAHPNCRRSLIPRPDLDRTDVVFDPSPTQAQVEANDRALRTRSSSRVPRRDRPRRAVVGV